MLDPFYLQENSVSQKKKRHSKKKSEEKLKEVSQVWMADMWYYAG